MTKQLRALTAVLIALLFCGVTLAQEPAVDISPKVHPNLAQAQHLVAQANEYIERAQKANHNDMGGHAERARQFLAQANHELKAAAEAANAVNSRHRR